VNPVDLHAMPADQYQRYATAAQVAEVVKTHLSAAHIALLDVGGFAQTRHSQAFAPLTEFLPNDHVFTVDLVRESLDNYTVASGLALPFPAGAFDLAVSCDTLEHIPSPDRTDFVDELIRVARYATVLIAPFDSESNRRAERALHEHADNQGIASIHLKEHLALGLPSIERLRTHLGEEALAAVSFPDGYLPNWISSMEFQLTSGQSVALCEGFARYYNRHISPFDRREPSYRKVVVVARPGHEDILSAISSVLQSDDASGTLPEPASATELTELLALSRKELELENARLRKLLEGYERGRFIRFMRWLHDLCRVRSRKVTEETSDET
jgi:hypothetical protein